MSGYSARDVGKLLGLTPAQVRGFVRSGFLEVERGPRRELRFAFQDLVLLRTAKELVGAGLPPRRIRRVLRELKRDLPSGRPLAALSIGADGNRLVVSDGRERWNPESGQKLFNFEVAEIARKVAPLAARTAKRLRESEERVDADEWFEHGCELEASSPDVARDAYRRALELDPEHADAHLNLGRLLHEQGELEAAEGHYRLALRERPDDVTAAFNLGVVLEDLGHDHDAVASYEHAIATDAGCADAHHNLARLFERLGETRSAVRHWKAYRSLTRGR